MVLLTVQPIACDQIGSKYCYDFDTKQFGADEGTSIFKMCNNCVIFVDDFAKLFCDNCNCKLNYVKQIKGLDQVDTQSLIKVELVSEDHKCNQDDDGNCGDDCIDCTEYKWWDSNLDFDSDSDLDSNSDLDSDGFWEWTWTFPPHGI